jgi:putative membrane protein
VVGYFGLSHPDYKDLFAQLTPINLLISSILSFVWHSKWHIKFIIGCLAIFLLGMSSEIIGVQTGMLFGNYNYSNLLGIKVFGVPLMIGINWLTLIYGFRQIVKLLKIRKLIIAMLLVSLMMILHDYALEPFAITLNLWNWQGGHIPLFNYLTWGFVSSLAYIIIHFTDRTKFNSIPVIVLIIQYLLFNSIIFLK